MIRYRLLALDLDGTLLAPDGRISEDNAAWIHKAVQAGVNVIFSTGRAYHTAGQYWTELQLDSPMVMANGAEIWEGQGKLYKRRFMNRDDQARLLRLAKDYNLWHRAISVQQMMDSPDWQDGMLEQSWMKFSTVTKEEQDAEKIRQTVESWGTLEVTGSGLCYLEFTAKGATKESGVREVCAMLNIQMNEVMAIGDGPNDIRLFEAVGLAVAMGQAADIVKEAADVVTDTNSRNGVAQAIRKYLLAE